MSDTKLKIFIQARMSSQRLPGKVLTPFRGKPIIRHVVDAATEAFGAENVVVLTSNEISDDPLAAYLAEEGIETFRGALNDVHGRFCDAIQQLNPEWVMRICADSPLIPAHLLSAMADIARDDADLVTNVHPRNFPKGHSVEIIRADVLSSLRQEELTPEEKEHVTPYFYSHAERFKIISVEQAENMADLQLSIDTPEDYDRLEADFDEAGITYDPASWNITANRES